MNGVGCETHGDLLFFVKRTANTRDSAGDAQSWAECLATDCPKESVWPTVQILEKLP
jgi:hypothetical protein